MHSNDKVVKFIISRIKKISIFDDIKDNEEYIWAFINICKIREFKKGKVVIKEGDIGSEMFIVIQGRVKINKKTRAGDDYTVAVLDAKDNIFFGEMAMIDDDKRSATVFASKDSEFLVINKNDFLKLGDKSPHIAMPIIRAIAKILAGRLRKTTFDMITLFDALVTEIGND